MDKRGNTLLEVFLLKETKLWVNGEWIDTKESYELTGIAWIKRYSSYRRNILSAYFDTNRHDEYKIGYENRMS